MMDQFGYGILYTIMGLLIAFLVYIAVWQPKKWK